MRTEQFYYSNSEILPVGDRISDEVLPDCIDGSLGLQQAEIFVNSVWHGTVHRHWQTQLNSSFFCLVFASRSRSSKKGEIQTNGR